MNRFALITDSLENIVRGILRPGQYPHREVGTLDRSYWIASVADLFFRVYLGAEYINPENIPESGSAIVAANHSSHLDGMLINTASVYAKRRGVAFLAASDIYNSNRIFRLMCDIANCIPINRYEGDRAALLKIIRLLRQGKLVGIFPEGQRSRDGRIGEGKEGAALIALATGCPVIPVGISGTFDALPRKTRIIKPTKVRLKFGAPLVFEQEKHPSPESISRARDQIMSSIKTLYEELTNSQKGKQKIAA